MKNLPQKNEYRVSEKDDIFYRIYQEKEQLYYQTAILFVMKEFLEGLKNYDTWQEAGADDQKI